MSLLISIFWAQQKELMDFKGQVQHILGSFTRGLILRMERLPGLQNSLTGNMSFSFFFSSFLPSLLSVFSFFLPFLLFVKKKKSLRWSLFLFYFIFCSSREDVSCQCSNKPLFLLILHEFAAAAAASHCKQETRSCLKYAKNQTWEERLKAELLVLQIPVSWELQMGRSLPRGGRGAVGALLSQPAEDYTTWTWVQVPATSKEKRS